MSIEQLIYEYYNLLSLTALARSNMWHFFIVDALIF